MGKPKSEIYKEIPRKDLRLGDEISWSSQAGGSSVTKVGTVIYVGERFTMRREEGHADHIGSGDWLEYDGHEQFIAVYLGRRSCIRADTCHGVIVRVNRPSARGKQLPPHYYCPSKNSFGLIKRL